jgi:hypothetical protein
MDAVMDHETLAAFVDGALSPEDSAGVVMHLADHPSDAAYVDALMELNASLVEAYSGPLHEPAPERILAAILGTAAKETAVANAAARAGRSDPRGGWRQRLGRSRRLAVAGVLAAAAAVFAVVLDPGRFGEPVQILGAPPSVDADLRAALETAPSGPVGTETPQRITLVGTFLDKTGQPCREYELLDPEAMALTQGVACRSGDGEWLTEVSVASRIDPAADRDAFVPASGAAGDPEALDRALDRLGAGMTLSPVEERALIANWRHR